MMDVFNLPSRTMIGRSIPKNAFDTQATSQQKKLFVDVIERMRWINKLSFDTINLTGDEIQEIQIFSLELRKKEGIEAVLEVINKAIPYHLICCATYGHELLISACQKHPNPLNADSAVIDWMFNSAWISIDSHPFSLNLRKNLDLVYLDICQQISGSTEPTLKDLVTIERNRKEVQSTITKLESQIAKCKQFNRKVELNIELQKQKDRLNTISR
ncbi:DUF4391 domain-containing protein [Arsenicibacter rosenii]|nr:DUF4391 domain-containing protein [Arsenicibacter rosenii]